MIQLFESFQLLQLFQLFQLFRLFRLFRLVRLFRLFRLFWLFRLFRLFQLFRVFWLFQNPLKRLGAAISAITKSDSRKGQLKPLGERPTCREAQHTGPLRPGRLQH